MHANQGHVSSILVLNAEEYITRQLNKPVRNYDHNKRPRAKKCKVLGFGLASVFSSALLQFVVCVDL
jgi:hypothetical protein